MNEVQIRNVADAVFGAVKGYIGRVLAPIDERLRQAETRPGVQGPMGPQGPTGERGLEGPRGNMGPVGERGETGPPGQTGARGEQGPAGARGEQGPAGERGEKGERGEPGPVGRDGRDGAPGERGEKGERGQDGESPAVEAVVLRMIGDPETRELLRGMQGPEGEPGRDGREGPAGRDGERGLDGAPGAPGRPGRDGASIDALEVRPVGRRSLEFVLRAGEREARATVKLPGMVVDAGVHRKGAAYEHGDAVTWAGSVYIAQRDTEAAPGTSPDWRLAVKRGRDGKDAEGAA